jgi:malonyl-CoA O-methyltransferase
VGVAESFNRASDYDGHADVQRQVATSLARTILADQLPARPRILELGCGTGFLSEALLDHLPDAKFWATDIAPAMVERARQRLKGHAGARFAIMDAAQPTVHGPFDIICSSLALQWVRDLPTCVDRLRRLLAPNGRLAFTTLGAGSFAEWRAAYGKLAPGTPDYPALDELRQIGLDVTLQTFIREYSNARTFLHALKAIGAGMPQPGYRPLSGAELRHVMTRFESGGPRARYVVATCLGRGLGSGG